MGTQGADDLVFRGALRETEIRPIGCMDINGPLRAARLHLIQRGGNVRLREIIGERIRRSLELDELRHRWNRHAVTPPGCSFGKLSRHDRASSASTSVRRPTLRAISLPALISTYAVVRPMRFRRANS